MNRLKSLLLTLAMLLCTISASAHDFEVDGIYYNITDSEKLTVEVTYQGSSYNSYSNSVVIPETVTYNSKTYSVTSIGRYAFYICLNLTSVTIPDGVTIIGDYTFYESSKLTSVNIPNSVTSIGSSAFDGTAWYKNHPDGLVYAGNVVYKYKGTMPSNTSIELAEGTIGIADYAFLDCRSLTSVILPNSVTNIGKSAFRGCTSLTSVVIPNNITSIGKDAFYNTTWYNNQPDGLVYVGKVAYKYKGTMPNNTNVEISEGTLVISPYAFENCSGLTYVTIPNSVTSIGDYTFSGCSNLASLTIGNSVTSIGESAFYSCKRLTSVHISDIAAWCNIKFGDYDSNPLYYAKHLFIDGKELTELIIPDGITSINHYAFYNCSSLISVNIPNSVTGIGNYAFSGCSLKTMVIGTGVLSIGNNQSTQVKTIWLTNTPPSGYSNLAGKINYVANEQYGSMSNKKVYKYLSSMFEVDGITYVPVNPSERTCDVIDYNNDSTLTDIKINENVSYKNIAMKVNEIMPYTFYVNKYIKSISLNNNGGIGNYAFYNCESLTTATLGDSIKSLGGYAFSCCKLLEEIIIPNAVKTIGEYCFENCSAMNKAIIGNSVETINKYAFKSCSSLPELTFPKSTTSIGDYAFSGCTGLKKFVIEDRETTLELGRNGSNPLFADCPLDYVYIGGDISYSTSSSYGYSPFYRNTSLREVVITDKETEISANEFYGCTNLQNFTVGDGVTTFGDWAFSGCSSLKKLSFGSQLKTIGKEAFSDCVAVTEITSKATTPPTCGSMALDDINKWECTLNIPKGCSAAYQAAEQWKEFFFITEGEEGEPVVPEKVCATPTISYKNGKLIFNCETEGAVCKSTITDDDIASYEANEVQLNVTYNISVYATKEGYKDSEVAKATLCWIDVEPKSEGLTDTDIANVKALPVVVQASNGTITVTGANDGTMVEVYGISGTKLGEAMTTLNSATIHTDAQTGSVVIVKVGNKSIKVAL